jgi:hypothetical protein
VASVLARLHEARARVRVTVPLDAGVVVSTWMGG